MKITQKKNQKPIELDIHFKYRCINCSLDHWLSYNQVRTKNYKIVCDCGAVFKPKRIKTVSLIYDKKIKPHPDNTSAKKAIPSDLINKCSSVLIDYGFTKAEATDLLSQAYASKPTEDYKLLIKTALSLIGVNND